MTVYPKYITFVAGEYPIISHEFGDIAPRKDADMSTPNEMLCSFTFWHIFLGVNGLETSGDYIPFHPIPSRYIPPQSTEVMDDLTEMLTADAETGMRLVEPRRRTHQKGVSWEVPGCSTGT